MPIDRPRFQKKPATLKKGEQIVIEGKAKPGTKIEIENLSAAPFGPSRDQSGFSAGQVGPDGHYAMTVASGQEGDWLRVRGQGLSTGSSPLLTRIAGTAPIDGRRPEVSQQSLRLRVTTPGEVAIDNVSKNQRLGEPRVKLAFENARTDERKIVTLDDEGKLPAGLALHALPGDVIKIYASDGHHAAALDDQWASLCVPLPASSNAEPMLTETVRRTLTADGPLFVDGASFTDPFQGGLGDCYLVAAASSVADLLPQELQKRIREDDDGNVIVTFSRWSEPKQSYVSEDVKVTRDLGVERGGLAYGYSASGSDGSDDLKVMETWWPLLEKAYAVWKGGYPAISSGYPYEIFEALLGREGRHYDPAALSPEACFSAIDKALQKSSPLVTWTWPDSQARPFLGSGLAADHAYSIHGIKEEDGDVLVQLRNPWGKFEPGRDGKDDGVFWLPLSKFQEHFCGLGIASA